MSARFKGRRGGSRSRMRGQVGQRSRGRSLGLWVAAPATRMGLRGWKEETRKRKVLVFSRNLHSRATGCFCRSIWLFPCSAAIRVSSYPTPLMGQTMHKSLYNLLVSSLCPLDAKHQFWRLLLFLRFFTKLGRNFHGSLTCPAHNRHRAREELFTSPWNLGAEVQ